MIRTKVISDQLVVESSLSIRMYCRRGAESAEMLEQAGSSLIGTDTRCGEELDPPRESVNDDEYIRILLIIGLERTDVVKM